MDWGAYMRTSGDAQKDRVTIALQIEKIQEWANTTGNRIVAWYPDDGVPSEIPVTERDQGGRMFREGELGKWQGIVVYDTDRWGRDPAINHPAMKLVREMGLAFIDLSSPGTDFHTDEGELMFTVKSGVARYEHRKILRRMRDGRNTVVRQGAWVGGIVPYGYTVVLRAKRKYLLVSETQIEGCPGWSEAEVVRRIFEWLVVEGLPCRSIARRLTALGIPTHACLQNRPNNRQDGTTRGVWQYASVRTILTNPTYKGVHTYGRNNDKRKPGVVPELIEREQPVIIPPETWERAQQQLKANQTQAKRNRRQPYLLVGKLVCSECGHRYIGTRRPYGRVIEGHWGYCCAGRKAGKDYGYPCRQAKPLSDTVEQQVWQVVKWAIDHPEEVIDMLLAEITEESQGSNHWQEERDGLHRALGEVDKRRQRAEDAYLNGAMPLPRYQDRLQQFAQEEAELREQIAAYQQRIDSLGKMDERFEEVGEALLSLRQATSDASWEQKRLAIERLVDRVEVGTAPSGRRARPPLTVVIAWHSFHEATFATTTFAGSNHKGSILSLRLALAAAGLR